MKKLLILSFAVLALAACANKAGTQDGLVLPSVNGKDWNYTAAVKSKPVMVTVMAGFCGYCKMMAPLLDELAGEYKGKDVDFVFVFVDDQPEGVRNIVHDLKIKNAKVVYNGGELSRMLGVQGFPALYLVNKDGSTKEWGGYSPNHVTAIKEKLTEYGVK